MAGSWPLALEIYSITEGGAGRDLRDQQLGHFAGEETEARREQCQAMAPKAVPFLPHSPSPLPQLSRPLGLGPAPESAVLTVSSAGC